jgi:hypothetical protein
LGMELWSMHWLLYLSFTFLGMEMMINLMSKLTIEPAVITNHLLLGYYCCNSKSE